MTKPVVGVIGNAHVVNDRHNVQLVGQRNLSAISEVAEALPLMFAGTPDITDIDALLGAVDGILLTGARANVHPTHFGVEPDPRHEPYDHHRDAMALALVETCVARGVPIFGICRGFQEMNVAFGGSLHPEIRDLPGRMNHRMPRLANGEVHPDPEVVFADRHEVRLLADGYFARLLGCESIRVTTRSATPSTVPCSRRLAPRSGAKDDRLPVPARRKAELAGGQVVVLFNDPDRMPDRLLALLQEPHRTEHLRRVPARPVQEIVQQLQLVRSRFHNPLPQCPDHGRTPVDTIT